MTLRYAHFSPETTAEAVQALNFGTEKVVAGDFKHIWLNKRDLCKVRSDALLSITQKQTAVYKDLYGTIYTQVGG